MRRKIMTTATISRPDIPGVTLMPPPVFFACLLTGGLLELLLPAALPLFLYLSLYVIPREEAYMERVFGDRYRAYRTRVRRWF
jgi:protein-S-isoprenylcysteine O-methyltransferase Ste14